jgi:hypothetical protein
MSPSRPEDTQTELEQTALERTALADIRSLEAVHAPIALRRSIEAMSSGARPSRRRRYALRPRLAGAGALAVGAVATAAVVLGSGVQRPPTVLQASRVALGPATLASPAENPRERGLLEASVEGVPYPYWGGRRGWPTAGARSDRLDGRRITTVFYLGRDGRRVGYAIVAGGPLAEPSAGAVVDRAGDRFHVLDSAGATVVTWREAGHTCILVAGGVPARTLLRLVVS